MAEPKPVFTWRHYVFGKNIIAGCLWMFVAIGAYILVLGTLVLWIDPTFPSP